MFKIDMIYTVSLSLGIKIHCGHLFLLQNVKTKQFIKFSLSAGDRLLKNLCDECGAFSFDLQQKRDSTPAGL